MTERILGTPGKKRRRRLALFVPLALLAVASVMLIAAAAAPAINLNEGAYNIDLDVQGANDEPNQKDLTLQGTDTSQVSTLGLINVLWNWDDTRVSGKNTMDACALFDSDAPNTPGQSGNADFAMCAVLQNLGSPPTFQFKESILYTCGDARADRCSSQALIKTPVSPETECEIDFNSETDPFDENAEDGPGDFYPEDTRAFCTVNLVDVGGVTSAILLNTCSYPSGEPNSDPSDCVVIAGRANPSFTTAPKLVPQDSATMSGVVAGGTTSGTADGKIVFSLYAPADTTCSGTALFSQAISVTADGPYTTTNSGNPSGTPAGYTISADGIYRWKVVYNGDSNNNPFTVACGAEQVNVDITP